MSYSRKTEGGRIRPPRRSRVNPRQPRGGGRVPPPIGFFRDSSEHAGDRELKLGIPDLWSKPDLLTPTAFLGQVRSLTYDVISEPLHGLQMSQLRNALTARGDVTGKWNLQDLVSIMSPTTCISRIFPKGHMRSGHFRDLTIISQWGKMKTAILAPGTISNYLKHTESWFDALLARLDASLLQCWPCVTSFMTSSRSY